MSQQLNDMIQLHSLFNKFLSHFVVGDAEDVLDVVQVIEMYGIMDEYLREVTPGD